MKTIQLCAVMAMSASVCGTIRGGEQRSPEQLGAHWARVSDVAEIQLVVDKLRANGGGAGEVDRKHLPLLFVHPQHAQDVLGKRAEEGLRGGAASVPAMASPAALDARCRVTVQGSAASAEFPSGERLVFEKVGGRWMITGGSLPNGFASGNRTSLPSSQPIGNTGFSVGETFVPLAVSREHGIGRLTQRITRSRLDRTLFGLPEKTASYIALRYMNGRVASATYIQLVLDPEWNRILYGNMDRWIKAYPVQGPSALAVDADGNVFVGQPAHKRVLVLKLVGSGDNVELQHRHQIYTITNPTDLAISDNGTPLDTRDDYLYVADATQNTIYKYTAGALRNSLVATFDGFSTPTALAVGRWNGANNRLLYVVDKLANRIRMFVDEGTSLTPVCEYRGHYSQYFTSVKTDHFGHVYVVESVHSQILKFTPTLELLDSDGGDQTYAGLGSLDIPFAKVVREGEGQYWTGFDQVFAVERWDDASGAQRRKLGVKLKGIEFRADADVSTVACTFTLTDVADVTIRIYDEQNRLVRTLTSSWMNAGQKHLLWERRGDDGKQVSAGTYRYEIGAASAYSGEPVVSNTRFSLPLYYHEDCGSDNRLDDAHLVQGSAVRWGTAPSQTANEHASSVQYRFTGLNPAGEYEVAAEFVSPDGVRRLQDLTANGVRLGEPMRVGATPTATGYLRLPPSTYESGEITIAINRLAEGSAIVTQLWMKEVGVGFNPQPIATLPTKYMLEQNYPNPFNPSTTIRFAIPSDGLVTLKVYSITGQEVATLVNEHKTAGKYEVTFDAKNVLGNTLASGVYIYRVTAGNFSEAKKMVLLR
jgi:flagellar hook assembly protein FlgD